MSVSVVLAGTGGDFAPIAATVRRAPAQFRVIHALPSLGKAVAVVRRHRPDLLLMGLRVPDVASLNVIRTISEELPTRVVVICKNKDAGVAVEALGVGAAAYIFTGTAADDVVRMLGLAVM